MDYSVTGDEYGLTAGVLLDTRLERITNRTDGRTILRGKLGRTGACCEVLVTQCQRYRVVVTHQPEINEFAIILYSRFTHCHLMTFSVDRAKFTILKKVLN